MKFGYVLTIFGKRVTALREKNGVSRQQLAVGIGETVNYVEKMETGKVDVELELIFKIIHHLDIPVKEFFSEGFDNIP